MRSFPSIRQPFLLSSLRVQGLTYFEAFCLFCFFFNKILKQKVIKFNMDKFVIKRKKVNDESVAESNICKSENKPIASV
jgi:hypothetical protein